MIARISTYLPCSEGELWRQIVSPKSLQYVASPVLTFVPVEGEALGHQWQLGKTYNLNLYFIKVIPLGRHRIQLASMDRETNTLASTESGTLARVWNHTIRFRQVGPGKLTYTDEIRIEAGWLTPIIWLVAHLFYRHRQRRWKVLLQPHGTATKPG